MQFFKSQNNVQKIHNLSLEKNGNINYQRNTHKLQRIKSKARKIFVTEIRKRKKSLGNFVQHDFKIYEKISFSNRNK